MPVVIKGNVHKQDVRFIKTNINNTPQPVTFKANVHNLCCIKWEVFAQLGGGNALYNDYSAPIKFFPVNETVALELEKYVSGAWVKQADLIDDTYGTFFDLREKDNIKPYGYKIEWYKVLDTFGIGVYRMKFDNALIAQFSDEFCLRIYNECLVDHTVRFTTVRNSLIGGENPTLQFDFAGLMWHDQFRLPNSIFTDKKANHESEELKLNSGQMKDVSKGFRENWMLKCDKLSKLMLDVILYDLKQNDLAWVTDYNALNFYRNINDLPVKVDEDFDPQYGRSESTTSLTMKFIDAFDNHKKFFS